jgi:arylsulfatase A-like enzyme
MDTHGPYFPTLSGVSNPFTAHYYTIQQHRNPINELPESTIRGLKHLYDDCVHYLDSQFQALDQFLDDDPIVVMTGDHGEAFNHGAVGHAQLYDEVITVPYLSTLDHPTPETVRHIDIPATLLDAVGLPVPDNWEGYQIDSQHRDSFTMNTSPGLNKTFVSLRTERHKLIREYDPDTGSQTNTEFYDLNADPDEQEPVSAKEDVRNELSERVDEFLARESIDWNALNCRSMESTSPAVEDRLESLGYL